jgi:hypothetical protein
MAAEFEAAMAAGVNVNGDYDCVPDPTCAGTVKTNLPGCKVGTCP